MALGSDVDTSSSSSFDSVASPRSSTELKHEHASNDGGGRTDETPMTSPEMSNLSEPKDLISMYTNVELGVVATMDRRDEFLVSLAEAKRELAKAEKTLARCRVKETKLLYHLQCIREEVADRRMTQADINVERAKTVKKRLCETPRLVTSPSDIFGALFRASKSVAEEVGVA